MHNCNLSVTFHTRSQNLFMWGLIYSRNNLYWYMNVCFNSEQCLGRNVKIPISRSHISLHIPHFLSWIISDSLAGISVPHQKFASTSVRIHFVNVFRLWVNGNLHFWPGSGFGLVKFSAIAMVLQTGSGMNKRVWWIYVVDTIGMKS